MYPLDRIGPARVRPLQRRLLRAFVLGSGPPPRSSAAAGADPRWSGCPRRRGPPLIIGPDARPASKHPDQKYVPDHCKPSTAYEYGRSVNSFIRVFARTENPIRSSVEYINTFSRLRRVNYGSRWKQAEFRGIDPCLSRPTVFVTNHLPEGGTHRLLQEVLAGARIRVPVAPFLEFRRRSIAYRDWINPSPINARFALGGG